MQDELSRGYSLKKINPELSTNLKTHYSSKLDVFDWLNDVSNLINKDELYEIRFKNTRKDFFYNTNGLRLETGDIVAVEASPGHDIGIISLKGVLVHRQLSKNKISPKDEFKVIYRKARPGDIEKWKAAIDLEEETMIESRRLATELDLNMKISDVEYQGDKTKAIFYYIADERVDFRQLIRVLADRFNIRVEMRQIGARQEAGRIGGIGSCGRELCCSTWVTNFVSVSTNSARYQELSLNPQKLAGQCSKLKCCLNYEIDSYMDERKDFPSSEVHLETLGGRAYYMKTDVYRRIMWYSVNIDGVSTFTPIDVDRVKKIIAMNKKGETPEVLPEKTKPVNPSCEFTNVVGQESLTRFDVKHDKKKKRNKRRPVQKRNEKR